MDTLLPPVVSHKNFPLKKTVEAEHSYCIENSVKICALNVCGLKSKLLYEDFEEFLNSYEFVCITESKLDRYDIVDLPEFDIITSNREKFKNKSGGIAFLYKKCYTSFTSLVAKSDCALLIKVDDIFGHSILFVCVYIPPEGSSYADCNTFDEIGQLICENRGDSEVCLLGDFNARTGVLQDHMEPNNILDDLSVFENELVYLYDNGFDLQRFSQDSNRNNYGYKLVEMCKNCNLLIVNGRIGSDHGLGKLTCKQKSVVDYIIVSPRVFANVQKFKIEQFSELYSDVHCALSIEIKKQVIELDNDEMNEDGGSVLPYKRPTWSEEYKNVYSEALDENLLVDIVQKLDAVDDMQIVDGGSVNIISDKVVEVLQNAGIKIGSIKGNYIAKRVNKKRNNNKPWYDAACRDKRKQLLDLKYSSAKNSSPEHDENVKTASKEYRTLIRRSYYKYKRELNKNLRNLRSKKPKNYWNIINNATKKNDVLVKLHMETFVEHFRKLGNSEQVSRDSEWNIENIDSPVNDVLDGVITEEELCDLVRKLPNNKAPGCDNITNEFIKCAFPKLKHIFVRLFNVVLKSGHIPDSWSLGYIFPIYKNKGAKKDPDNYRGITLLSCISKLFTSLLNSRLTKFLDSYGTLNEEQAGFRAGYATTDHIFVLDAILRMYLHRGKKLYCAFVDFKKAFDSVDRVTLWQKLLSQNIGGNFLRIIHNLYSSAKSKVKMQSKISSEYFLCNVGVRQGENLSPVLFALFLNDLSDFLSRSYKGLDFLSEKINELLSDDDVEVFLRLFLLLYADDTIIMAETPVELQNALNAMCQYCETYNLCVNTSKTKVVIFSKGKIRLKPVFTYNNAPLEVVDDFIYLGVKLNYNGSYNKQQVYSGQQANKNMFSLISKCRNLNLDLDLQVDLFECIVQPVLLYGSEIWGAYGTKIANKTQLKYYKQLLHLKNSTCSAMVLGEIGKLPMEEIVKMRILNYWFKIVRCKNPDKLTSKIYSLLYSMSISNGNNFNSPWLDYVKSSLNSLGMSFIWLQQKNLHFVNDMWFKNAVKLRIHDQYRCKWHSTVMDSSSCTFYRMIKTDFCMSEYMRVLPKNMAIKMARFRCRNHKFPVVTGSYTNDSNDKKCQICDNSVLGDEFHVIFECPGLETEREEMLGKRKFRNVNSLYVNRFFNSGSRVKMLKLCKFIAFCMSLYR